MISPHVGVAVDHAILLEDDGRGALVSKVSDTSVPTEPPVSFDESSAAHFGVVHPAVRHPQLPDFAALFPKNYANLPAKYESPFKELRFMSFASSQSQYAIPCAKPEGKVMVAAGYADNVKKAKALANYIQLYYPQLKEQLNAEDLAIKAHLDGEGPSLQDIHELFQNVTDKLGVAPCEHLQTLFNGSGLSINASLTNGHCGSFLFDLENPLLFYGLYTRYYVEDGALVNLVWSVSDPVFVYHWVLYALPDLKESGMSEKVRQYVAEYIQQVKDTIKVLNLTKDVQEFLA